MATYVLPQVLVFQDFTVQPAVAANPLSAHIAGGHAFLVRQSDEDEREFGNLGLYDNASNSNSLWPNRPAGAEVDPTYTKLYIENALLQYFTDDVSAGSAVTVAAGYSNRISSDSVNFSSNGAYARDAALYDRDVKIGDIIRVRGVPTGTGSTGAAVTLWTYVRGLVADKLAASIGAAAVDASNAITQSFSESISQTGGAENCVDAAVDGSTYDGLPDGKTSETYTITVLDSSIGGDFTTARLRVTSASGTDDVAEVIPAASGSPTAIGTRGLTVTFSDVDTAACSLSADNDAVSYNDLISGQEFTATVAQSFTASTATSGGTYDSTADTTYIVEVTKGGDFASLPEISVATTNGIDQSGPHVVTALASDITIGTEAVTIQFGASTQGLNKGDRFYIAVQGVGSGPVRTIQLGTNLDQTYAANDEVGIELYIRKPLLEVSANRTGMAPLTNWEQSKTEIKVKSGIVAYDTEWTNSGVALPLSVYSAAALDYGVVYVEYRAWRSELCNKIGSLSDVADIDDISGSLTPDNPLKWGVFKALSNSNGTPVLYTAVCGPDDPDNWDEVFEILLTRDDAYNLVPLTRNATVFGLYQAHVNSSSAATEGLWRVAWFNLQGVPEIPIVSAGSTVVNHLLATTTDGAPALAVFEDDPQTSGTQYTICRVPTANSNFITNGVRPGDIIRGIYTGDGFGNFTYSEFVVDEVQSENQIRVAVGPGAPQSVPAKIEVWRNLSAGEEAVEVGRNAGIWNDRRIRATWPDLIESSGTLQEGYHLNAALAGLASGVLPHQGLTNVEIAGFSSTQRTNDKFNKPQLNAMAVAGVWIVQQQLDGEIFTRHAVTTGDYEDINQREEMLTRNVDSISYRFKDYFEPFIGVTNVTPSMRDVILGGMNKLIRVLRTERVTVQLGGQLIDATIDRFFVSEIFKDRYVAYISLQVPYALNNIELHLVV
jgi:hypothetical protein